MATNVAKGVALTLGVISASVSMQSGSIAKAKTGNVMVCDTGHEATQINQQIYCPGCEAVIAYQQQKKARPVDGGLVVLEAEDLAAVAVDATKHKKTASMTAHPVGEVELSTSTGDKFYFMLPDAGHETSYAALLALVTSHPELAFMALWTPRSALGQYRVVAHQGVLCLQERVAGSGLRPAPDLEVTFDKTLSTLAEQMLVHVTAPYDPASYADSHEERLAEILATKEVVPVAAKTSSAAIPAQVDLVDQLQAFLAEQKPAPKKRAPRKPAAKKVTA